MHDGAPAAAHDEGARTTRENRSHPTAPAPSAGVVEGSLDIARRLIAAGIPVFVAKAARDDETGGTGGTGYWLPARWQETPADVSTLDTYEPGDALAVVCGHGLDALDVDPRNGGADSLAQLEGAGIVPQVIARQDTPSGGEHLLVNALGIRSRDGFRPGLDLKAGDADGEGRGFVFIAPTVKLHKGTGEVAGYSWTVEPMLEELDADDDTGAALAALVESARSTSTTTVAADDATAVYEAMNDEERAQVDRYLDGVKLGMTGELASIADWPEGKTDERGRGWQKITADAANRLGRIARAGWSPWTLDEARVIFLDVIPGEIAAADRIDLGGIWRAQHGRRSPAAYPQTLADSRAARKLDGPTTSSTTTTKTSAPVDEATEPTAAKAPGKREPGAARRVAELALEAYDFGLTPEGEPFAVPRTGPGIAVPLGARGGGLRDQMAARMFDETGTPVSSEALTTGLSVAVAKAKASAVTTPMHLRVAEEPGRIVLDLGQPGSAACVVVTPGGWTVEERPPAGVLFRRPPTLRPLPTPVPGGSIDPLRTLLGFDEKDPRWLLVRGWLPASLRASSPRPLLLMLGAAGTGKTARGRLVVNVLDPRAELGSSFGRNLDDDRTKAHNSYLLGYDNLTSISEAVSDQICRTVTGDASEKRRNYSDTDVVVMSYRRTGVLTAITLPALRADALERVIPIPLERMAAGERRSETDLARTFTDAHPSILGAVLDDAATMLAGLPAVLHRSDGPRMLDYWQSLAAIDPGLADAFTASADDILATAAEDDPIVVAVRAWLRDFPLNTREGEPADEFASLDRHARTHGDGIPDYWPKNPRAMSTALVRATNTLAAVGIAFTKGKTNGRRVWRFVLDEDGAA